MIIKPSDCEVVRKFDCGIGVDEKGIAMIVFRLNDKPYLLSDQASRDIAQALEGIGKQLNPPKI